MFFQNLTKKYYIKRLGEIVGQKYVCQFLGNSLHKNAIFPLYLFSGMRGTGKTTTARIFSLINICEKFKNEGINVLKDVPCYECENCSYFLDGVHPDIIEIDAASNSGVENIRNLIENTSLLPVYAKKKFYIIDEVHMLSKAAFNACLKIMEDPPENVHFILATTEIYKVIDTIRSRSIILNFFPIDEEVLGKYLFDISKKESINISIENCKIIAKCSDCSVRDSLNNLERIAMISTEITDYIIKDTFFITEKFFIEGLLDSLLNKDEKKYNEFRSVFNKNDINRKYFFEGFVSFLQSKIEKLFSCKNKNFYDELSILKFFFENENLFLTSIKPEIVFDLYFYSNYKFDLEKIEKKNLGIDEKQNKNIYYKDEEKNCSKKEDNCLIENFLHEIKSIEKPIVAIFNKSKLYFDEEKKIVFCVMKKTFSFYRDFLREKEGFWLNILKKVFGQECALEIIFDEDEKVVHRNLSEEIKASEDTKIENAKKSNYYKNKGLSVNANFLPEIAVELNEFFPGKTSLVRKIYSEKK
jgi:DNA polymerase-3 subunit gamma/tau